MSIAQNFPTISPSLLLDFANVQALDPRITFTRATTATYYGTRTAKAEENLVLYSQEFDNAYWLKDDIVVTANSSVAPDGTTTAETVADNATNSDHRFITFNSQSFIAGLPYTLSIFAKNVDLGFVQLAYGLAPFSVTAYANFDLSTGVLGTVGAGTTAVISSVGSGWYRCSITVTASASASSQSIVPLITSSTSARSELYAGTGKSILVWGAQLEQRSSVTAYTPTTTQPITNYIPVLETAASSVARFDHNPTTFESLGLMVEQQSTNLVTYSDQFDNAAWTKDGSTITSNTIVAPDGTLTGDKLVENTATAQHRVYEGVTVSAGAHTFTFYAKAAERNWVYVGFTAGSASYVFFDLINGVVGNIAASYTASISAVGNGWYRCSVTRTETAGIRYAEIGLASADNTISYTGNGFNGIFLWGAQLEATAFSTSYIPTVASQVTRAADVATMTGTNFTSWYNAAEGTVYSESVCGAKTASGHLVAGISDGSINNALYINQYISTNIRNNVRANATDQAILSKGTAPVSGVSYKSAMAYKINDIAASFDGEAIQTDTLALIPFDVNRLTLGNLFSGSSQPLNGHIKKLSYYPIRLSNTNLVALTG